VREKHLIVVSGEGLEPPTSTMSTKLSLADVGRWAPLGGRTRTGAMRYVKASTPRDGPPGIQLGSELGAEVVSGQGQQSGR
jgi:hypothetical protein